MDKDHDGFISRSEFASVNKCMSPKQVMHFFTFSLSIFARFLRSKGSWEDLTMMGMENLILKSFRSSSNQKNLAEGEVTMSDFFNVLFNQH